MKMPLSLKQQDKAASNKQVQRKKIVRLLVWQLL